MERLALGDVVLAYEDTGGDGPAVVFVHGLGGSAYGWWAQLAGCRERGYRGVAYDQRGAGLSDDPGAELSVELWAEDVERLLDGLGIERAALVGHSVGCMVAEQAAHRLGDRAWALALCGGRIGWPEEAVAVFEQRARLARDGRMDEIAEAVAAGGISERGRAERPDLHGLFLRMIAANEREGYALAALATGRGAMLGPAELEVPVLAFAGAEDPVTPPGAAREIAAAARSGEAAVVEDAAHWCMLERPEAVTEILFSFLDRHRDG